MDYLFLAYGQPGDANNTSHSTDRLLAEATADNNLRLREGGTLKMEVRLYHDPTADTMTVRNGEVMLLPAAAPLIGVYLIHANDLNDAIRTASTMPQTWHGTIEIWTVDGVEGL